MEFLTVLANILSAFLGLLAFVLVILLVRLMLHRESSPIPLNTRGSARVLRCRARRGSVDRLNDFDQPQLGVSKMAVGQHAVGAYFTSVRKRSEPVSSNARLLASHLA